MLTSSLSEPTIYDVDVVEYAFKVNGFIITLCKNVHILTIGFLTLHFPCFFTTSVNTEKQCVVTCAP